MNEDKAYGVVQDDGTVTEYPSERAAEKASGGGHEALVVKAEDGSWVYPATGRTFHPSDVADLSPARASKEANEMLDRNFGRARGRDGFHSDRDPHDHSLMHTRMNVLKQGDWKQLASRMALVFGELPGTRVVNISGEEPFYNYFFVDIIRVRAPQ
jgi:hypothetical protein